MIEKVVYTKTIYEPYLLDISSVENLPITLDTPLDGIFLVKNISGGEFYATVLAINAMVSNLNKTYALYTESVTDPVQPIVP